MVAYTSLALARPVVLDREGRSSGHGRHRGPDDVVAVVLASDAAKGLRVAGESAGPAVLFPFYKRRRLANVLSDVMEVARTNNGQRRRYQDPHLDPHIRSTRRLSEVNVAAHPNEAGSTFSCLQ